MQLTYDITPQHYQDVIAFQLRLRRSRRSATVRYILSNAVFFCTSVYYFFTNPGTALWIRLGFVAMALLLFSITTSQRSTSRRKVLSTYRRYEALRLIEPGYIGTHTLAAKGENVVCRYGEQRKSIHQNQCALVHESDSIAIVLGGGVVFDIIPLDYLHQDNHLEQLRHILGLDQSHDDGDE